MKAFEKSRKESKKKFLKEKQDKRKNSEFTPAREVNTANSNPNTWYKRKDTRQIIRYKYSKKDYYSYKYTKPKKDSKLVLVMNTSALVTESWKTAMPVFFEISEVSLLQRALCI